MPTAHLAWATFFQRRGWTFWPHLAYAYRAPMLFGGAATSNGICTGVIGGVDEQVRAADYDGRRGARAERSEILYIGAHGRLSGGGFALMLHSDEWRPAGGGLAGVGPRIAVFDACNLVDPADPAWATPWEANSRPALRLVLGFGSKATVNRGSALRGEEFADRLAQGQPVAAAWIGAVRAHGAHSHDRPVAIAFGEDQAEVDMILDYADLDTILGLPALPGSSVVDLRT